ncbi:AbiU2 domain-containing protein [Rossellomorea marisflavi]|uniref:AbiU2 domain-containing protein n=1 Tax=Rossellomorea marisflavi TaxID=189381 RepID=UPI003F9F3A3B
MIDVNQPTRRISLSVICMDKRFHEARDNLYIVQAMISLKSFKGIKWDKLSKTTRTVTLSLLNQVVFSICSFFEYPSKVNQNLSIRSLMNFLRDNLDTVLEEYRHSPTPSTITKEILQEHERLIYSHKKTIDAFFSYRNQFAGHFDMNYVLNKKEVFKNFEDIVNNIQDILSLMDYLLSFYMKEFANQELVDSEVDKELKSFLKPILNSVE